MSSQSVLARIILVCGIAFLIFRDFEVSGANVALTWNRSPTADTAGYNVHYGLINGQYTSILNAGAKTNATVTGLQPGQTCYFVVAAYNPLGIESPYSNKVTNSVPALPLVLVQPVSQIAAVGTIVVLSVDVASGALVSFQWFLGGVAIKGATNSQLILPQISEANAGNYTVVMSNPGGSVTSQVAAITVPSPTAAPVPLPGPQPTVPAGNYAGLYYETAPTGFSTMTDAATGLVAGCAIQTNGYYSARLVSGAYAYSLTGRFNAAGIATAIVYRTNSALSNLSFTLYGDAAAGAGQITGVVSNMDSTNPWAALLTASLQTNAFSPVADYLFLSPPPAGQHQGIWTCQLAVASSGNVLLSGQLGDGAQIWQTGFIGANGSFPVYQSLYNNTGLLAGWITLADGAPIGDLIWIQPANPVQSMQGFTNVISFGAGLGLSTNRFQLMQ
jgi:hypothetical protein